MGIKKYTCGNEIEKMPNIAFHLMAFMKRIVHALFHPEKCLDSFGIQPGQTIIDYGCGPGFFLKKASRLVGENGTIYAADIHRLAINSVKKLIAKHHLTNVKPVLINVHNTGLDNHCADVIYVLDTFHMINDTSAFLTELHRLLKENGYLIIDEGHQSREQAKKKILQTKLWKISEENKNHMKCTPIR